MKRRSGFTVIELLVMIAFLLTATIIGILQVRQAQQVTADTEKKTAINAMYYSLEEAFYKQHGYYPESLQDDTLPTMDKQLLIDPVGRHIGSAESAYHYEPRQCHDGKCQAYTLRADLSQEDDFVRESRQK